MPTEEQIAYSNEVFYGRAPERGAHGLNLVHPALRIDPDIVRGEEANELARKFGYRSLVQHWLQHHPGAIIA